MYLNNSTAAMQAKCIMGNVKIANLLPVAMYLPAKLLPGNSFGF